MYSNDDNNPLDSDIFKLKELYNEIHEFSLKYKHKQKKSRRSSVQEDDLLQVPRFQNRARTASDLADEEDEYSIAFDRSYG
jgi:hypothetical protein